MKNYIGYIAVFLIIGYIIFSEVRHNKQECIIEDITRKDSIQTEIFNKKISRQDSINNALEKKDSVVTANIIKKKKSIAVIEKKYEDNNSNIPFLPIF